MTQHGCGLGKVRSICHLTGTKTAPESGHPAGLAFFEVSHQMIRLDFLIGQCWAAAGLVDTRLC
jgi:hypothetical protein